MKGGEYSGTWEKDKRNGEGKFKYSDDSVYQGSWIGNRRHGKGIMNYANGAVYEGQWKEDQKCGMGTTYHNFFISVASFQNLFS